MSAIAAVLAANQTVAQRTQRTDRPAAPRVDASMS
jgi:hypothetical protein